MAQVNNNQQEFVIWIRQQCQSDNKQFKNIILVRPDNIEKKYFLKKWGNFQGTSFDKVLINNPHFKKNKDKVTRDTIRLAIDSNAEIMLVPQENGQEAEEFLGSLYSQHPLPVAQSYPGSLHSTIFLATQVRIQPTAEQNNNVLFCNVTDNISTKYPAVIFNVPIDFQLPSEHDMVLINGIGRPQRNKSGIVFRFGVADIIIINKHQIHSDPMIENKRSLYLHPRQIEVTSKEIIEGADIEQFVINSDGLERVVHSQRFRAFLVEHDLHKNIIPDPNGEMFYNGTQHWKVSRESTRSQRFKVKPVPMRDVVFRKPVEEALGYERDEDFALDIMERLENKYYNITLMYAPKPVNMNEPAPQRRRLNNGNAQAVYCKTGYISVTSMEAIPDQ